MAPKEFPISCNVPRLVIASTLGLKGRVTMKKSRPAVILAKARIQILKGFKSYYELDPRFREDDRFEKNCVLIQ